MNEEFRINKFTNKMSELDHSSEGFLKEQELPAKALAQVSHVLLQCRNVRKKAVSVHSKLVVGAQKSLAQLLADIDDIEGQEVNKIQRMIEGQANMQLGSAGAIIKDRREGMSSHNDLSRDIYETHAFDQKLDLRFEPNRLVTEFINQPRLGAIVARQGLNFPVSHSGTLVKQTYDWMDRRTNTFSSMSDIPLLDQPGGIHVMEDINLNQLMKRLRKSWSACTLSSITDNAFYDKSGTSSVAGNVTPKILNSRHRSVDIVSDMTSCCSEPATLSTAESNDGLPKGLQYLGSFEACRHRTACVIPDICVLHNGFTIVLDHYHKSVQMFDTEFQLVAEEVVEFPMGVCTVHKDTVAITLRRHSEITIFSVEGNIFKRLQTLAVPCKYYLWQVVYKDAKLFVMCDENNIHVLKLDGTSLTTINSGVPTEMGFIRNFDVSHDTKQLYLCERSALRCISSSGETIWRITSNHLPVHDRCSQQFVFEDVCCHDNYLFGSMWKAGKIALISTEGRIERYIVTKGIDHPRAMSVGSGKLLVTQFSPDQSPSKTRTINVFSLANLNPTTDNKGPRKDDKAGVAGK